MSKPRKNTTLENGYIFSKCDEQNNLILFLTNKQIHNWKNSNADLRILQKVVGEKDKIVDQQPPYMNEVFESFYKNASTNCGFDISKDDTKIIASPEDDKSYFLIIPRACVIMQVLNGKSSDEIKFEYIEIDSNNNIINLEKWPN